jgi:hypothetical protein
LVLACFRLKELRIVVNSKYWTAMSQYSATKVASEILIAMINTQCKLATLRRKNHKIIYKNEIFKANEHASEGVVT